MTGDPLVRGECRDEEQDVGRLAASSWADGHELPGGVPRSELVDAEPVVAGTGPPASVIAEPPTTDQSVVGMTALVVEAEALRPDSSETDGTHPGTPLEVADAESPAGEGGQWGDLSIAPRDLPVTMWAGETLPSQVASSPLVRPRRRAAPILRILRGRVPPAGLASWSVPPPPGARLLVLSGQEVSRRVTALFALIEGEDAIVDLVHNALRHAFAPGSAADRLSIAAADRYLRGVLEQALVSAVPGKEGFGVETVLWIGTEALVCSLGDARTYLCRDLDLIRIQAMPGDDSPGRELRMARRAVQTGDRLVLLDSAAQRITDEELREALSSCPSLDDAAGWLAALARARGGDQPSVLVVQIGPGTGGDGEAPPGGRVWWTAVPGLRGSLLALVSLLLAVLVVHSIFAQSPQVGTGPPPSGLQIRYLRSNRALLSWLPVANAIGYRVTVGGRQYSSRGTHLSVGEGLQAGETYAWTVRAQFRDRMGPPSRPSSLRLPKPRRPTRRRHTAVLLTPTPLPQRASPRAAYLHAPGRTAAPTHPHRETPRPERTVPPPIPRYRPPTAHPHSPAATARPTYRPPTARPLEQPTIPRATYQPPTPRPTNRPPDTHPVYVPPTPPPTVPPPTPRPVYRPPVAQPTNPPAPPAPTSPPPPTVTPVPTSPVLACPNPPTCG